jgi:hypothetical protein
LALPLHLELRLAYRSDRWLAEHFGVPDEQIARRRDELAGTTPAIPT